MKLMITFEIQRKNFWEIKVEIEKILNKKKRKKKFKTIDYLRRIFGTFNGCSEKNVVWMKCCTCGMLT